MSARKSIASRTLSMAKRHSGVIGGSSGLSVAVVLWCYQTFAQKAEMTSIKEQNKTFAQQAELTVLREQNGKLWHEIHQLENACAQHQIYVPPSN